MAERQTEKGGKILQPTNKYDMHGKHLHFLSLVREGPNRKNKKKTIQLANTCTVDNLLYFIFLAIKTRPSLLGEIECKQVHDKCFKLLLKVYQHFMLQQWPQGKNILASRNIKIFPWKCSHLDYVHQTKRQYICNGHDCPNPTKEYPDDTVVAVL